MPNTHSFDFSRSELSDDLEDFKKGKSVYLNVLTKDGLSGQRHYFQDAQITDAERRMNDAYAKSVEDLNAWRDSAETSQAPTPVITADALSNDAAYQRSVDDLNAWRYR